MIVLNKKRRLKILWKRVFGHDICICDVHLKSGKVFYDITDELWDKHHFGRTKFYREVNDDRVLLKQTEHPSRTINRIVFQCSSCNRQLTCNKIFKGNNRREEG